MEEKINRRTARTNADILEVFLALLDVLGQDFDSDKGDVQHAELSSAASDGEALIDAVNTYLADIGSPCVALPEGLTAGGIDATASDLENEKAEQREKKTKDLLTKLAESRGGLFEHSPEDISSKMTREDLEILRKRVCSTENHGVPYVNKCLYHLSGGPETKYRLDPVTMELIENLGVIEKIGAATYRIKLSIDNKEGQEISRRISELREMAKTSKEKGADKEMKEQKEVDAYMKENVDVVSKEEALENKKTRNKVAKKKVKKETQKEIPSAAPANEAPVNE